VSVVTFEEILRLARRGLLRAAEAARPQLEGRIADGVAEAAVWAEETADGVDLWIAGDGMDPEEVRRLVTETFPNWDPEDDG